ncbi:MAG: VPLPA-CTERM sorting domain-containing protein [Parvularculaceae bacterium]
MEISRKLAVMAAAGLALFGAHSAFAADIISNGTIMVGVDDLGQLNPTSVLGPASPVTGTTVVGLRFVPTGNESTSHGCLCEGWGVGIADTGVSGFANNSSGTANLTPISFVSDGVTATSVVELTSGELRVTHAFAPAAETPNLYRVTVTIENISGAPIADLRYTRTFDWDVEPSTFDEFVTHAGVATTPSVLLAIDNGFVSSDPFAGRAPLLAGGTGDFVDLGPSDHGSNFDFSFGALAAGESFTFDIFYGAAATEAAALAALGAVAAELFSLGQCSSDAAGTGATFGGATCNTFIFGFAGVGGEVIVPSGVIPLPAALPMFLTGLGGVAWLRRRKRALA